MRSFGAAAIAAATLFVAISARAEPPPVEAFGNLPGAEFGRLSPDGRYVALVKPIDGRMKFVFLDLTKTDAKPYVVGTQDGQAENVLWKSGDHAICIFHANLKRKWSRYSSDWSRAVSVDLSTQTAKLLMWNAPGFRFNYNEGSIADVAANDPDHVYMSELDRWDREYILGLYRVDIATGRGEIVHKGNSSTIDFLTDGNGNVLGRIDQGSDLTNHVFLGDVEAFAYKVRGGSTFEIDGLLDGSSLEFGVRRSAPSGTTGLYQWSPNSGFGSALYENPTFDLDYPIFDERNGRVIGVSYVDDMTRVKYFDPEWQRVQALMEKAFPGQSVVVTSKDDAGKAYVVLTDGPRNPPVLSLFTTSNHQVNTIEEAYPLLKPSDLGEVKPYPYKARDGLDIHAYLTLPPGKPAHNLPTVIFPHGGPEARDSMDFDWWAQFMASRGYAVLQPNYRGSSGYGWNFVKAGDGQWVGKVQHDLDDGVQKLIAEGIADPKRICVVGASWGGYLALVGATFSPDIYACAISYAGVSDMNADLYTGTTFDSELTSIWKRRVGADVDSSKMDSQSPANFASQVKAPVLLVHGDMDTTVRIKQSEIEERALRRAGKQVEFVTLKGDDHYLEVAATRIQLLKEVERFLAAHIGDPPPKPAG